ncbi:MAG: RNA pyrophosphohydrolase [Pseudomonadota bacterium]
MSSTDLARYRPNVGVALFNRDGDVWIGRRVGDFGDSAEAAGRYAWQMPQGGVDEGESILAAARRELAEETGVENARPLVVTPGWLTYDFPSGLNSRGFRGQRQKWVAMLFDGADDEIRLDTHTPEFDQWRWAPLTDTPDLIVPFKRNVYLEVAACFHPLTEFLKSKS